MRSATKHLNEGLLALASNKGRTPKLEYLEGIAKLRCALSIVAEMLVETPSDGTDQDLLQAAEATCTDEDVNCVDMDDFINTVGPGIYLIKLLGRQYGLPQLKEVSENHKWIIPAPLRSEEVSKYILPVTNHHLIRPDLGKLICIGDVSNILVFCNHYR